MWSPGERRSPRLLSVALLGSVSLCRLRPVQGWLKSLGHPQLCTWAWKVVPCLQHLREEGGGGGGGGVWGGGGEQPVDLACDVICYDRHSLYPKLAPTLTPDGFNTAIWPSLWRYHCASVGLRPRRLLSALVLWSSIRPVCSWARHIARTSVPRSPWDPVVSHDYLIAMPCPGRRGNPLTSWPHDRRGTVTCHENAWSPCPAPDAGEPVNFLAPRSPWDGRVPRN